jgi:hypothetical protein
MVWYLVKHSVDFTFLLFLTLASHFRLGLQGGRISRGFYTRIICFLCSPIRATCPASRSFRFNYRNSNCWPVWIMKVRRCISKTLSSSLLGSTVSVSFWTLPFRSPHVHIQLHKSSINIIRPLSLLRRPKFKWNFQLKFCICCSFPTPTPSACLLHLNLVALTTGTRPVK